MLKVIASMCICNNASMNIYEINEDYVLVGINNEKPEECELGHDEEGNVFIEYGDEELPLGEFMRVGL